MATFFRVVVLAVLFSSAAGSLQFSRNVKHIADDSSFQLEFTDGCSSMDEYGSNDCRFSWGDKIDGAINAKLGHDLDSNSKFNVNLKLDTIIPWKFSCSVCGENCSTTVPIIDHPMNFAMPSCPLAAGELKQILSNYLPDESPAKGIKVTAKGTVDIEDSSGDKVVYMSIDVLLK